MIEKYSYEDFPSGLNQRWLSAIDNYRSKNNIGKTAIGSFLLASSVGEPTPENTGLIHARVLLGDLEDRLGTEKKYVLFQSFYSNGDCSTIDVVRLPIAMHREIIDTYLNEILPRDVTLQYDKVEGRNKARFMTVGGFAPVDNGSISFTGKSGDFADDIAVYSSNDIAAYLVNASGVMPCKTSAKGEQYVSEVLDLMARFKLQPGFFSHLVDFYLGSRFKDGSNIAPHIIDASFMNRVYDRAEREGKGLISLEVEEMTSGILREIMVKGVAAKIARKKE